MGFRREKKRIEKYLERRVNKPLNRISVAPECITAFNELKLGKGTIKYIIYKLSDDYKEIVVEEKSADGDWEAFQSKLMNAKAAHKGNEGKGPRYAVYDFEYELEAGEGKRYTYQTKSAQQSLGANVGIGAKSRLSPGLPMRVLWSL